MRFIYLLLSIVFFGGVLLADFVYKCAIKCYNFVKSLIKRIVKCPMKLLNGKM